MEDLQKEEKKKKMKDPYGPYRKIVYEYVINAIIPITLRLFQHLRACRTSSYSFPPPWLAGLENARRSSKSERPLSSGSAWRLRTARR